MKLPPNPRKNHVDTAFIHRNLKEMILQGVSIFLLMTVAAAVLAAAAVGMEEKTVPADPAASPTVAAEALIHTSTDITHVFPPTVTPVPTAQITTLVTPKVLSSTPTPTPTPTTTATPHVEGAWTVKDTGKDSNPREAGISYESEDAHVNTNISTSSSGSGKVDQSTSISVTVNGETKTIED